MSPQAVKFTNKQTIYCDMFDEYCICLSCGITSCYPCPETISDGEDEDGGCYYVRYSCPKYINDQSAETK